MIPDYFKTRFKCNFVKYVLSLEYSIQIQVDNYILTRVDQNQTNPIEKPQTVKIETAKNRLIRMYLDHFFTQPHGLVWFAVFILPTEPN